MKPQPDVQGLHPGTIMAFQEDYVVNNELQGHCFQGFDKCDASASGLHNPTVGISGLTTLMNHKESLSKEDGIDKIEGYFRNMVGCLMYLTTTRPNIVFAVSILSHFMHCASEVHLRAVKRVIRYIKGIIDFGVKFKKCQNFKLLRFSDNGWGGSVNDMKSKSGYCFSLGSGVFSWCCKK